MSRFLRLLRYVRPYSLQALLSVVLMAAVGLLEAFRLLLIKPIFDRVLDPAAPHGGISLFNIPGTHYNLDLRHFVPSYFHNDWNVVAFALIVSTIIKGLCDYGGTYLVNYAGFGMITDLRDELYEAILRRSVSFFQKHATGTILSTLINDIERVQYAMSSVLSEFLQQAFTLLFTIVVVIGYGGKLAWVLLIFLPVVIGSARKIGRQVRTTTRRGQDKLAEIQNILHETVTGNRIVKAFNMELWETLRFKTAARRLFRANLRSVRAQAISSPLMDSIGAIAIALLLWVGRIQINHGAMTEGTFFAFIVAVFKLYDPVRKFALFYNNFQTALGASSEIFSFMDAQDDVRERPRPLALKGFRESIRFEDVGFAYSDEEGEREVLHHIDLEIRCGEVVALVGPSGAGKSTMVNLVPRFFDVSSGRILIDGNDVRDVSLRSLREQIGKVTQETILFNDTVRNNIAYGQPDISFERVISAAQAALAHDFILNLPDGYDTVIGEKGFRLSGGERQRLAIARALLKNAPILILDEATSALDSESEALVQAALANLMAKRTSIVIAHRLSTVRRADRIAVIESGRITAIGPHEELLRISPTYQRLNQLQFSTVADAVPAEPEFAVALDTGSTRA
ncbi:Lipid A export ATP-binding/permease protein MsbA [Acidisarcina polymorpha]|uniref:Lipid A export ATP-binding/permease protein MsbA n=1 Tax=Acidisarcina polymorpha TaxID=2211140 RepID=A0A2Z5FY24_9BACT|nr:ABC transporter ATP-binding protein [Acidisarcina polymorpha]AXC11761.1 Lipid A export ATP-binding/permease protein MsbA [Acidisarcina polymorpha]